MFDPMELSKNEAGVLRLFRIDLSDEDIEAILTPKADQPPKAAAIAQLVGLDWIDDQYAELFHTDDLGEMGLATYLVQGQGIPSSTIEPDRLQLTQVDGYVLILLSKAFEDFTGELALNRATTLIDVYTEEGMDISFEPLPSRSATEAANLGAPPVNSHLVALKAMLLFPFACALIGIILWLLLR